jgi:hypothetical protein
MVVFALETITHILSFLIIVVTNGILDQISLCTLQNTSTRICLIMFPTLFVLLRCPHNKHLIKTFVVSLIQGLLFLK